MWICGTLQSDVGTSRECKPGKCEREVAISGRGAQTKILGNPTRDDYKVLDEFKKNQRGHTDDSTIASGHESQISMSEIRTT